MMADAPDFRFSTRSYGADDGEGRTFEVVGEIARIELPTLKVAFDPDAIYIEMRDKAGNPRKQVVDVPEWADTDTAEAVQRNGVLTVTVEEDV